MYAARLVKVLVRGAGDCGQRGGRDVVVEDVPVHVDVGGIGVSVAMEDDRLAVIGDPLVHRRMAARSLPAAEPLHLVPFAARVALQ